MCRYYPHREGTNPGIHALVTARIQSVAMPTASLEAHAGQTHAYKVQRTTLSTARQCSGQPDLYMLRLEGWCWLTSQLALSDACSNASSSADIACVQAHFRLQNSNKATSCVSDEAVAQILLLHAKLTCHAETVPE